MKLFLREVAPALQQVWFQLKVFSQLNRLLSTKKKGKGSGYFTWVSRKFIPNAWHILESTKKKSFENLVFKDKFTLEATVWNPVML